MRKRFHVKLKFLLQTSLLLSLLILELLGLFSFIGSVGFLVQRAMLQVQNQDKGVKLHQVCDVCEAVEKLSETDAPVSLPSDLAGYMCA